MTDAELKAAIAPLASAAHEQANHLTAIADGADDRGARILQAEAARWLALADQAAAAIGARNR